MYSITEVFKGLRKPREILMELNAQLTWRGTGTDYYPDGIDVMEEDWDYLVVLDALRYDIMVEECDIPGQLSKTTSRGTGTQEWLRGNFRGRSFPDTVYVNGNPQLDRIASELDTSFYAVENIWQSEWDEEVQTVRPESVRQAAVELADEYPNKRLLIHFIQPHEPFIGPTGKEHDFGGVIAPDDDPYFKSFVRPFIDSIRLDIDEKKWEKAYRENLRIALPEVEHLFDELEGKFVVTSDHGELINERVGPIPIRYNGHRIGCHHENLLTVPWLEYTTGQRRHVLEGEASTHDREGTDEAVKSRLRQLGYAE
ncbi:alkaline phosphatase family protein [Halosegnis longus]|uniref:hypothetical protein n=1 Tax=Halosegnis longus TaxID=2216012 RepID=UPI00096A3D90|nr:hypothetical protein [Salella cibi]